MDTESRNLYIGGMAHVFAAKDQGPRANVQLTDEERGAFENLILLYPSCHSTIDKAPEDYPDCFLIEWKRRHRERIATV